MMEYEFHCSGHPNIRARHHKTIEFTKELEISLRATCVLGVKADFDLAVVRKLSGRIKIDVEVSGLKDEFYATVSRDFNDEQEMVFRKSEFSSRRTLGVSLDKGANELNRDIAELMRNPDSKIRVVLTELAQ